jgi:hypothetical protein
MNKKYLIPTMVVLALVMIIPSFAFAANLNPNKLYGAPSYVLNLVGKKADWSGGGTYDNPSRHTIFVPQTTADGSDLQIWMTQGEEFAVLDGNAFDEDGDCDFQLGAGKYAVFIVALGKPGNGANIDGWIYNATDSTYLLLVGTISVNGHSKTPRWEDATDLFFVSTTEDPYGLIADDTWVFDYIDLLDEYAPTGDYLYLWTLDNNNNKLLQVRFYQI